VIYICASLTCASDCTNPVIPYVKNIWYFCSCSEAAAETSATYQQGALAALKQGNPGGGSEGALEGVLTHSLAGLSDGRVSMFLDVATILQGEKLEVVMALWTAWHGAAATTFYRDLSRRTLLGADAKGRLVMHDVLVALGRGIILQSRAGLEVHCGSRLWVQDGEVMGVEQVTPSCVVLSAAWHFFATVTFRP
jgi:hypothetical protein